MALLLACALGRALPILLGALAVGWLENLSGLARFHKVFEVSGGILLILSGLYMPLVAWWWAHRRPVHAHRRE